jgi:hypothetical protein
MKEGGKDKPEAEYLQGLLTRVIAWVQCLADHCLTFLGTNSDICEREDV